MDNRLSTISDIYDEVEFKSWYNKLDILFKDISNNVSIEDGWLMNSGTIVIYIVPSEVKKLKQILRKSEYYDLWYMYMRINVVRCKKSTKTFISPEELCNNYPVIK